MMFELDIPKPRNRERAGTMDSEIRMSPTMKWRNTKLRLDDRGRSANSLERYMGRWTLKGMILPRRAKRVVIMCIIFANIIQMASFTVMTEQSPSLAGRMWVVLQMQF